MIYNNECMDRIKKWLKKQIKYSVINVMIRNIK